MSSHGASTVAERCAPFLLPVGFVRSGNTFVRSQNDLDHVVTVAAGHVTGPRFQGSVFQVTVRLCSIDWHRLQVDFGVVDDDPYTPFKLHGEVAGAPVPGNGGFSWLYRDGTDPDSLLGACSAAVGQIVGELESLAPDLNSAFANAHELAAFTDLSYEPVRDAVLTFRSGRALSEETRAWLHEWATLRRESP